MKWFNSVDKIVAKLNSTMTQLLELADSKNAEAVSLYSAADKAADECSRANRIANKLRDLLD